MNTVLARSTRQRRRQRVLLDRQLGGPLQETTDRDVNRGVAGAAIVVGGAVKVSLRARGLGNARVKSHDS